MPVDYATTVLIGDSDTQRSAFLADILQNNFRASVVRAEWYQEVNNRVLEALTAHSNWKLVLMAAELPQSVQDRNPILPKHFDHIAQNNNLKIGCVYTDVEPPDPVAVGCYVPAFFIPGPHTDKDKRRAAVIDTIDKARIGLTPRKKSEITVDDDPVLAEQIGALGSDGNEDSARAVLAYLIGDFHGDRDPVIVSKLIQGASGSKVFRFRPERVDSEANERVIKIVHYSQKWKLDEEVKKHLSVQEKFDIKYKRHIPEIESFDTIDGHQHITQYNDWHAIAYDFLGGRKFGKSGNRFGKFMDLETALIGSNEELRETTANTRFEEYFATPAVCADGRRRFLELLLNWLSDNWYLAHSTRGSAEALWDYSPGADNSFERFPPYRIPARSKRYILNFLDSRTAQMGSRLFDVWDKHYKTVRSFIAEKEEELSRSYTLAEPQSVILSPAHGDLNSNNILLWLDEVEHPFLIDFPFYQESGHALQDFARLETEVKFTLMDRQADSSPKELPAFDYTHSQVRLWQALEEHLLTETWDGGTPNLPPGAFDNNVRLSHELVKVIRTKAFAVQNQHQPTPPLAFWSEYKPALLYYTLRSIGYDSLSPFKRILAVSSAAHLLNQSRVR
jgi:hypothetical protein